MLAHLSISDFAIVARLDLDLHAGMTVLTGETGAGKSILIDALGLTLGERASTKVVRSGAERAEVVAVFDFDFIQSFEAVGRESRADHIDGIDTAGRHFMQNIGGVRLNPGLLAEARLVADRPFGFFQSQLPREQFSGLFALCLVGIAALNIHLRQAVERHQ